MEKMQTVYMQNPALGDPKQVQQSLEVTHGKLDDLNAELYKFKVVCACVCVLCVVCMCVLRVMKCAINSL